MKKLTPEQRREIARKAAETRWAEAKKQRREIARKAAETRWAEAKKQRREKF